VQDIRTFEYSARVEELAGFFRDQRWMHMHDVLRSQGITFQELGHRGREAAIASLERQGYTGDEDGAVSASTEFARRGGEASIEANVAILAEEGFSREEALRAIGKRLRKGALASLERQGFTGEDGTASASTELGRRGGDAYSAIYRRSGNCSRPGCTYGIERGDLCKHHQPKKTKKIDNCKDCGRVFVAKERVRGGVCNSCYQKPETVVIRKKATEAKKDTRRTCSTPGCPRITHRGTDKCRPCTYPGKS
jgi:hypothetical protein